MPRGITGEETLLRLPADGGSVRIYRSDSLVPLDWRLRGRMPDIRTVLGANAEDRMAYAVGKDGDVIGLDLVARRQRPWLTNVHLVAATEDGGIMAVDSNNHPLLFGGRSVTELDGPPISGSNVTLARAPGISRRIVTYSPTTRSLALRSEDGVEHTFRVPAGQLATSWLGDVAAITTDSGVVVVEPGGTLAPRFIKIDGIPIAGAFSPSAHQFYLARSRGDLLILNRFGWDKIATIKLPGAARQLRPDRSGRWLLCRPASGEMIWLVDLVRREVVATIPGPWAHDLPQISGGRTLLMRSGDDLVAWDIVASPPTPSGRLRDAASDHFLLLPWTPAGNSREQQLANRDLPDEQASEVAPAVGADSAVAAAADTSGAGEGSIFIQVSSSQNVAYARALVRQLDEIGFPARLLDPKAAGDGYRVVIGPYPTREDAEAAGRRLGRPYFVMRPDADGN